MLDGAGPGLLVRCRAPPPRASSSYCPPEVKLQLLSLLLAPLGLVHYPLDCVRGLPRVSLRAQTEPEGSPKIFVYDLPAKWAAWPTAAESSDSDFG